VIGLRDRPSRLYLSDKRACGHRGAVSTIPFEAIHHIRLAILLSERVESRPGEKVHIAVMDASLFAMVGSGKNSGRSMNTLSPVQRLASQQRI